MRLPIIVLLVLWNATFAFSQATGTTTGEIRGLVSDEMGAILREVDVTATNSQTGFVRSDKTNDGGAYALRLLPLGNYRVVTSAAGFQAMGVENIQVTVGSSIRIDLRLKVSIINESLVVGAERNLIDRSSTEGSKIVDNWKIQNLPINQRNFLSFAVTTPGVVTDRGPQSGGAPTSGLSINGQSPRYNNVVVDGLDNNDPAIGSVRSPFSQEAVQEYQVIRNPFAAEYGRTVGGVINIVTRSGSNTLDGSAFYFFRNDDLSARNGLSGSTTPLDQHQFGGSIGGALKRDRLFFFGAIERLAVSDANVITISDHAVAVIRANGFDIQNGVVPFGRHLTTGLGKIDYIANANNSLTLRGTLIGEQNENQQQFGGQIAKSAGGVLRANDAGLAASWISILSPAFSNEFRALINRRTNNLNSHDPTRGVAVIIQGVARFGMRQTLPQPRYTRQYQVFDGLTYASGRATYKVGFDYARLNMRGSLPLFVNGQYQFSAQANGLTALQSFATSTPSLFIQAFGDAYKEVTASNISGFAEGKWNLTSGFLVHFGVRYELEDPVDPFPVDANNWAPRISFSWSPNALRVRGGVGRFYGVSSSAALFSVGISNGVSLRTITRTSRGGPSPNEPWLLPNRRFENEQQAGASVVPQTILSPGAFATAYSDLSSLGIERELFNRVVISVEYVGTRGRGILIARDINAITTPPTGRPNPAFANIYSYESSGNSWYNSLSAGFQTCSRNLPQVSVFYTYAKAEDDFIDWRTEFQAQDPFNLRDERGSSVHTPQHRLTLTGIYSTAGAKRSWWRRDWTMATIAEYNAGRPFNQLAGFDRNRNGDALSDRPVGAARNQGRLTNLFNVDLRLARRLPSEHLKVDAVLDVLNLFNRTNVLEVQNVANQPGFGRQPLRLADPRRIQLGVRMQF